MTKELPWVNSPAWVVKKPKDYTGFFSKLLTLGFPEHTELLISGTSLSEEITVLLKPYLDKIDPLRGLFKFLQSENRYYRIPLSSGILRKLDEQVEKNAAPELCSHLLVVSSEKVLLNWYDFPWDPVYIAGNTPKDSIHGLATLLKSDYEFCENGV